MPEPIPIPLPVRGLVRSVDAERVPPDGARECENWIYRDGDFRVRPGLTALADDIDQRPTGFLSYDDASGAHRLIMGTVDGWWAHDSGTGLWVDIADAGTPLTSTFEQQVFKTFQKASTTWLLGTNGADTPKKWNSNPATDYAVIGGTPPKARCMMVLADRVLLGNLKTGGTISPAAIDVSTRLDFDTGWGSILTAILSNARDIIAMEEMGEFFGAIYCMDSIWLAIAQSGAVPFTFEPKKRFEESDGPASTLGIVRLSDGSHAYLSRHAKFKRFDGSSLENIWGEASQYVRETANISTLDRAWGIYDAINDEVLYVYPEVGNSEPTVGIIIKPRTGANFPVRWTGRNMTAGTFSRITTTAGLKIGDLTIPIGNITQTLGQLGSESFSRRVVLGEAGGQAYETIGDDDAGTGIGFSLEGGLFNLGTGTMFKTVKKIEHRFVKVASPQTVDVKIGKSNNGDARTLSAAKSIDIGEKGPYKTGHRRSSKFLSLRLEGTATSSIVWRGSYAEYVKRGGR